MKDTNAITLENRMMPIQGEWDGAADSSLDKKHGANSGHSKILGTLPA